MKNSTFIISILTLTVFIIIALPCRGEISYPIVDTAQDSCFDNLGEISAPVKGAAFYGQDAQYPGRQPCYKISDDGLTIYDNITALTWTKSPDLNGDGDIDADDKKTLAQAKAYPETLNSQNYGGYNDWRLPTIKELYSLMNFQGIDPSGYTGSDTSWLLPFIDDDYFDFGYGDVSAGERIIDAQFCSSTEYSGTVFNGQNAVFGLNLADGRIKGYPSADKTFYVYFVRGNTEYGKNNFVDNGDGTITDLATGLMWQAADSTAAMNWQQALEYAENLSLADHNDWRLPNAKELQSLIDYTRSLSAANSPAIDPVFACTSITDEGGGTNYPFYWSSTTHINTSSNMGGFAVYLSFGEALGWMGPEGAPLHLLDVHGAGAQRSDPKSGNVTDYFLGYDQSGEPAYGHGPQGDVIRINNFVRCVRDAFKKSDLNVDGKVNFEDFARLSISWQKIYFAEDISNMVNQWLSDNGA